MRRARALAVAGLIALEGLTGCFSSVHNVTRVQDVGTYRTATASELETALAERDANIHTLSASVVITASTGGGKEGKIKTFTSFRGFIFVRKPRDLRVLLQLPFVGSKALDMVSDGKTFTLVIPHSSRAIVGTNEVSKPSANGLENLRPAVFLDSLLIAGVAEGEYAASTQATHVLEAAHGRKPEIDEPAYDLSVYKPGAGRILQEQRVVRISRVTLLPYEQDIFDAQGRPVTQAVYENYAPVGEVQFPRLITISRPLDEYSLKIEVTKLSVNERLENDEFELQIPSGYTVQHME